MEKKPRGQRNSPLNHDPEAVRYAVRKSGLTQLAIAEQLKVSASQVSEWLNGTRNITQPNLVRLAELLNCPVVVLEAKRVSA